MCKVKNKIKSKSGQAMVEFALVLPILMMILGATITFGQMLSAKQHLQAAAQLACRRAIVQENSAKASTQGKSAGIEVLNNAIGIASPNIDVNYNKSTGLCTVTASADVTVLFPIGESFSNRINLKSKIVMLIERKD